jgi:mRNA interferase RelE/StbE
LYNKINTVTEITAVNYGNEIYSVVQNSGRPTGKSGCPHYADDVQFLLAETTSIERQSNNIHKLLNISRKTRHPTVMGPSKQQNRHNILIARSALRKLASLPAQIQQRITEAIDRLAANPQPRNSEKLKGQDDMYRIPVGKYRVVYQVSDVSETVLVLRVGHRRDIYRGLK